MDARATDRTTSFSNMGESGIEESSDEDIDNATMSNTLRLSASLNSLIQAGGESFGNLHTNTAGPSREESDEYDYAFGASEIRLGEDATITRHHDYTNASNHITSTTSFTNSGSSSKKQHNQESDSKRLRDSDATTSYPRAERDERQMEANRVRARDVRKRKKHMVEEMHREIVKLTMANQQIIRQIQIQSSEIQALRCTRNFVPKHSVSIAC